LPFVPSILTNSLNSSTVTKLFTSYLEAEYSSGWRSRRLQLRASIFFDIEKAVPLRLSSRLAIGRITEDGFRSVDAFKKFVVQFTWRRWNPTMQDPVGLSLLRARTKLIRLLPSLEWRQLMISG
jgi:hypothetical protein